MTRFKDTELACRPHVRHRRFLSLAATVSRRLGHVNNTNNSNTSHDQNVSFWPRSKSLAAADDSATVVGVAKNLKQQIYEQMIKSNNLDGRRKSDFQLDGGATGFHSDQLRMRRQRRVAGSPGTMVDAVPLAPPASFESIADTAESKPDEVLEKKEETDGVDPDENSDNTVIVGQSQQMIPSKVEDETETPRQATFTIESLSNLSLNTQPDTNTAGLPPLGPSQTQSEGRPRELLIPNKFRKEHRRCRSQGNFPKPVTITTTATTSDSSNESISSIFFPFSDQLVQRRAQCSSLTTSPRQTFVSVLPERKA